MTAMHVIPWFPPTVRIRPAVLLILTPATVLSLENHKKPKDIR